MKRKTVRNSLILAGAILVIIVARRLLSGDTVLPVTVETEAAAAGDISAVVTATGTIEPTRQVEVGTQVSGVVKKVYVDYNSRVKAGQLIAELDKTTLLASVAEARASHATAMNEQSYLQKIFDRQKGLFQSKLISEADYDEALYKLNAAKGATQQRASDLDKALTNLSYADIYSPIDGVILSIAIEEGQTVAASFSTPTLFTIAQNLTQMQVEADVDEADIGYVKEGQRVAFTVDAFPEEEFAGTVTQVRLNATVTSSVVTYTVVVKADNPQQKLMPGMTATISVFTKELTNVLTIREKSLGVQPDADLVSEYYRQQHILSPLPVAQKAGKDVKTVWVQENNHALVQKTVKIGESDGINVQVLEGLKAGERVVLAIKQEESAQVAGSGSSPFMPKPPGKKK